MNRMLLKGLASVKNPVATAGRAARTYSNKTAELQDALVGLLGGNQVELGGLREKASRMAASPEVLAAIRVGLPAAVVAAPAVNFADNESYANQGMDLLGMGAGMYGMHRGLVGKATAGLPRNLAIGGAGLAGLAGSDLIQLLAGGGEG